ncbi:MAG: glycosyltransferase family 4 protein [Pseudomonadota bacterium]
MQTIQLADLMRSEGVDVTLLQSNAPYRPAWAEKLWGVRAIFRLLPYLVQTWRLAGRVDVIHLMANSGWSWQLFAAPVLWLAWARRTPVIVNYRGGEARDYLTSSVRWVRPSMRKASSLIVPSTFLQEVFAEFDIAAHVIPNIVDLDTFQPGLRSEAGDPCTVVITRNLEAIYGIDAAIRAIHLVRQRYPQVRLKIAGSGPQLGQLELMVQELGLDETVEFVGRLDRKGIVDLYRHADVMLNPTRVDNMPNSVLEALACGLPVVSTHVGGVPYIVEDGETALLVPPDDEDAMADALLKVLRDDELYSALRTRGQALVERYGWHRVKAQWLALYKRHGLAT